MHSSSPSDNGVDVPSAGTYVNFLLLSIWLQAFVKKHSIDLSDYCPQFLVCDFSSARYCYVVYESCVRDSLMNVLFDEIGFMLSKDHVGYKWTCWSSLVEPVLSSGQLH